MNAAWAVYWITRIGELHHFLDGLVFLACVVVGVTAFGGLMNGLSTSEFVSRTTLTRISILAMVIAVVCSLAQVFVPSKDDLKLIAAAYGVQTVVQSKTGQQVLDKGGLIISNALDQAIEKTGKDKQK